VQESSFAQENVDGRFYSTLERNFHCMVFNLMEINECSQLSFSHVSLMERVKHFEKTNSAEKRYND